MNDLKVIELYKMNNFMAYIGKNDEESLLNDFSEYLLNKNRFFNNNHSVLEHIRKLFDYCTITLTPNDSLFRARVINLEDNNPKDEKKNKINIEDNFFGYGKKDSFVRKISDVQANRANSIGIPCLYAAKEEITAVSEIRPFIGNEISVAVIKPIHNLKIFDLYFHPQQNYDDIIKPPRSIFWLDVAIRFSIPYEDSSRNEYLLTQCISEYIRISGFDGIQYSSSLHEGGKNIAIFNCKHEDDGGKYEICEPVCSDTRFIKSVKYEI